MWSFIAVSLVSAVVVASASVQLLCQNDSDCSRGEQCVRHANFSSSANCESVKYCISVRGDSCECASGYTCRVRDCPRSRYECNYIENRNSRCGWSVATACRSNELCGYEATGLVCIKCPCYGTHVAKCVKRDPRVPCPPRSMVFVQGNSYTCVPCASETTALTGPSPRR
ncbi:uncharacterized protein LOC135397151 [Ornithodoros turicata]|uniref:uncharacterized protein LOC135397151 n=1 Tax=Ornithodoros turicata TaxID=34597 RepID=UPI0031392F40